MNRFRWVGIGIALAACDCASNASSTPARDPEPPAQTVAVPPAIAPPSKPDAPLAPVEPACTVSSGVRLRINPGQTLPTGTGLFITNEGVSHDNFGPEGFDMPVHLLFRRGNEEAGRMPSFRDHRPDKVLGHCYRLVDADSDVVLLDVSALPEAEEETTPSPTAPPMLEGFGGTPPPGAPPCSITHDNGPLPGGKQVTHGCAPNEMCVCEAQAGYSCSGRCASIQPR